MLGVSSLTQLHDRMDIEPGAAVGIIHLEGMTELERPVPLSQLRGNGVSFASNIVAGKWIDLAPVATGRAGLSTPRELARTIAEHVRTMGDRMAVTASQLRQDVYRLLDEVLSSGVPLEIERKGRRLRIVPDDGASRLDRIHGNPDAIIGDPEDLVHLDWSSAWQPTQ